MLFFILYKIGELAALCLPVRISYKIASLIATIKYYLSAGERREIIENLRFVLPQADTKALKRCSREITANFSRYLVDFFRFRKIDRDYIEEHVVVEGANYLEDGLAKGKGVILLSAHLGSWELGGAVIAMLGYPISVLALDHKNKLVNNFFINQRRMKGEQIISINFAVRRAVSALANNEFIAIVGDKDFTNTGIVVKFFGKDTLLPKGPAVISLKTGAAIVPGFLIRLKGDKFKLFFEKPVECASEGDFEKDVVKLTQQCTSRLEDCIRRYSTQWYCFRRFWLNENENVRNNTRL